MEAVARKLVEFDPHNPEWWASWAQTTAQTESLDAASALIQESVSASLTRSNFNTIAEIVSALESVGLDKAPCEPFFPAMALLMERRHHIVHRADRNPDHGQGQHAAKSIGRHHVQGWAETAQSFFDAVYAQLPA